MANWSNPTLTSLKVNLLSEFKDRDSDAATMAESPTSPPVGYKRWVSANNKFQTWNGSAWVDLVLSIEGGGTGGATQVAARAGLGLGSLAVQNSNAVSISGGSITGLASLVVLGNATIAGQIIAGSSAIPVTNSAGNVLESAIADGSVLARVASNEIITGGWTFTNSPSISGTSPYLLLKETDAPTDEKNWRFVCDSGRFYLQTLNDLASSASNVISVVRSGMIPSYLTFGTQVRGIDGAATVPTFTFVNDPQSGIYQNTTNSVGITVGGTLGLSVRDAGSGNTLIDPHSSKWAFSLIPSSDGSFDLGRADLRWNAVRAVNGTIQTSDIRHKNNHGEINQALDIVNSLTPFIASWKTDNDGMKFPALSAQEVSALLDSKIHTNVVNKDRLDCWSMNYSNLIPVLVQAVKDLYAEVQGLRKV